MEGGRSFPEELTTETLRHGEERAENRMELG
jgi:hypothetical protein